MLMRVFLGWLRGERGHCGMVAVPTVEEEDAKRPRRERENLVGERTRIINRMKAALARLGIRGFKPELRRRGSVWTRCIRPKNCRFRQTRLTRGGATSTGWPSYASRSRRSSGVALSVWN